MKEKDSGFTCTKIFGMLKQIAAEISLQSYRSELNWDIYILHKDSNLNGRKLTSFQVLHFKLS